MAANEVRVRAKNKLGVPVYDAESNRPFCEAGFLDIYGDHAIAYRDRGEAILSHYRIRVKIESASSSANHSPILKNNFIL